MADIRKLLKCAVCGTPYERGCDCNAVSVIRAYIYHGLAEREAKERELPRYEEMARRGVL